MHQDHGSYQRQVGLETHLGNEQGWESYDPNHLQDHHGLPNYQHQSHQPYETHDPHNYAYDHYQHHDHQAYQDTRDLVSGFNHLALPPKAPHTRVENFQDLMGGNPHQRHDNSHQVETSHYHDETASSSPQHEGTNRYPITIGDSSPDSPSSSSTVRPSTSTSKAKKSGGSWFRSVANARDRSLKRFMGKKAAKLETEHDAAHSEGSQSSPPASPLPGFAGSLPYRPGTPVHYS